MPGRRLALLFALTALPGVGGAAATAHGDAAGGGSVYPAAGLRAARPLPFYYDLYTFRGPDGSTAVVSAFAVQAGHLETELVDGRVRYRFSVTLVLADTALRTVSNTHDTVYVAVPRAVDDEHLLYTHVEVTAPPSTNTRQRVIMIDATTPGIGQLYTEVFPIPDYTGSRLMLSDVALGQPGARSGWRRDGVTLALLPTSQFPSSAFDVYYEIYNLPQDNEYTTEIAIRRSDVRGEEPVRLRFVEKSGAAPGAAQREFRRVEAALPKGAYELTVTITDHRTGQTATRARSFEVHGWPRGATMVPARRIQSGRITR